jgi:hypothetical protein
VYRPRFSGGGNIMRSFVIVAIAATFTVLPRWQSTDAAAASKQQHIRSLGQCVHIANARGWSRAGEKGRWPFIRRCMEGKPI